MGRTTRTRGRRLVAFGALVGLGVATLPIGAHALGSGSYNPLDDAGSPYALTVMTGARRYWQGGFTGAGVDVAMIDSGVVTVNGLATAGKVVHGPDLSFDSQAGNLTRLDGFGHGTHMAGLIAGHANGVAPSQYANDTQHFLGMAPDARIVSVKVANAQGATDVSQVIAAIDWVVQHRRDPGINIRVLNLSFGTDSDQGFEVDPLAYAVERAWRAGIFVVVAAGNAGFVSKKTSSMTSPAYNPNIMAVGAADPNGTLATDDDTVPAFSSNGNKARRPDMVTPGAHLVSLRVPGSFVDVMFSAGAVTPELFRGSGTSQAAAVMSGAAALVIQQRPTITPDQLRKLLTNTADPLRKVRSERQGAGTLDLARTFATVTPNAARSTPSKGAGALELARGSVRLVRDGVTLRGERDIFGRSVDSAALAAAEDAERSWAGGVWNGSTWSGSTWSGSTWSGSTWSGSTWSGSTWSGSTWSGSTWSGSAWSGSAWLDNWASASRS